MEIDILIGLLVGSRIATSLSTGSIRNSFSVVSLYCQLRFFFLHNLINFGDISIAFLVEDLERISVLSVLVGQLVHAGDFGLLCIEPSDFHLFIDIRVTILLLAMCRGMLLRRKHSLTNAEMRAVRIRGGGWCLLFSNDHWRRSGASGLALYHDFFATHDDHALIFDGVLRCRIVDLMLYLPLDCILSVLLRCVRFPIL